MSTTNQNMESDKIYTHEFAEEGLNWNDKCVESEVNINVTGEKRVHDNSSGTSIDEDGFTTVTKRRPKRLAVQLLSSSEVLDSNMMQYDVDKFEVCLTSKEILPKQMALAKLLRSENIKNIISIKYKSPYKILIESSDKENAEKMLSNRKLAEMDIRCSLTQEVQSTYGIVRNVDLDVIEEEMINIFESTFEILSIKRLNKFIENNKWVESETVRVCFKSSTLPSYIQIYGCRFKVEPYTFPVTQCSGCWRYGHTKKYCPTKKIICPKCGEQHQNCETQNFVCINCKGNHMALNKTCPTFQREKDIRKIMCMENCTYRKGLQLFNNKKKIDEQVSKDETNNINNYRESNNIDERNKTYRDALVNNTMMFTENLDMSTDSEMEENNIKSIKSTPQKKKRKIKNYQRKDNNKEVNQEADEDTREEPNTTENNSNKKNENRRKKFDFMKFFYKVKEVIFSQNNLDNKIKLVFKIILEEIKMFVLDIVRGSDGFSRLFGIICDG